MRALLIIITASAMLMGAQAQAALNSYLYVTGETQGDIRGGVTQAGREDSIEVYGFSHEVISPRDAATGLATGKRQHKPLIVVTPIDKSTPLLFYSLTNHENLTDVRLDMYQPSRTGKEVQYFTIELVNASVASIRLESGDDARDPHKAIITFTYQKIIETWQDGGITAEDDWETPVAKRAPARLKGADRTLKRN